jgi:hypothetical protein
MRFFTFTLLLMQVFHICASNGHGGHIKHSFLCPNGTLFQQQVRKNMAAFCHKTLSMHVTICQEEYGAFLSHDIGDLTICQVGYGPEVICRKRYEPF